MELTNSDIPWFKWNSKRGEYGNSHLFELQHLFYSCRPGTVTHSLTGGSHPSSLEWNARWVSVGFLQATAAPVTTRNSLNLEKQVLSMVTTAHLIKIKIPPGKFFKTMIVSNPWVKEPWQSQCDLSVAISNESIRKPPRKRSCSWQWKTTSAKLGRGQCDSRVRAQLNHLLPGLSFKLSHLSLSTHVWVKSNAHSSYGYGRKQMNSKCP